MTDTESAPFARVVVVSGTSSGIGPATALATARAEWTTVAKVVNNAGSAYVGTIENDNLDEVRACLEVNFFGARTPRRSSAISPALA
jgi:NADP-dependent 3-hydroxy acid dehydrogenase YdfG